MRSEGGALCVITARGGSKRIPRKNIRDFCGKPIIAYSIEAALESGLFDEVMVSTDDEEIAEVARAYGAKVPFMRSAATSDDYATTADVLLEVLDEYEARERSFDVLCCLYPTAPFVTGEKLRGAMRLLEASDDTDMAMPVVAFSFPPQRGLLIDGGAIRYAQPEHELSRSQDLPRMYHDCGQFYLYSQPLRVVGRPMSVLRAIAIEVPESEVQDIDNVEDWKLAEMKYRLMLGEGEADV